MKKLILLVDDEPELRRMVASLLTGAGYEVAEAADCAQARAAMAAQRPDAVLLDVMLPDGDGFSLLPELRLAFSYFAPVEADRLAARAAALHGASPASVRRQRAVDVREYEYGEALDEWAAARL